MATRKVEDFLDACLPAVLSKEGHSVYLRDPGSRIDPYPLVQAASWAEAKQESQQLRMLLGRIIDSFVQEFLR